MFFRKYMTFSRERSGYGGIIVFGGKPVDEYSGGDEFVLDSYMELTAIMEGLRRLPDGSSVIIYTNSKYASGSIRGDLAGISNKSFVSDIRNELLRFSGWEIRSAEGAGAGAYLAKQLAAAETEKGRFDYFSKAKGSGCLNVSEEIALQKSLKRKLSDLPSNRYYVNEQTKKNIRRFNNSGNHTEDNYADLKVIGNDGFSEFKRNRLASLIGEDLMRIFESRF